METEEVYATTLERPLREINKLDGKRVATFIKFFLGYLVVTAVTWVSMHDDEASIQLSTYMTFLFYPVIFVSIFMLSTKQLSKNIDKRYRDHILKPCVDNFIPSWSLATLSEDDRACLKAIAKTYNEFGTDLTRETILVRNSTTQRIRCYETSLFQPSNSGSIYYFEGCLVSTDITLGETTHCVVQDVGATPPEGFKRRDRIFLPGDDRVVAYIRDADSIQEQLNFAPLRLLVRYAKWHNIPFTRIFLCPNHLSIAIPYEQRFLALGNFKNPLAYFETLRFTVEAIDGMVDFAIVDREGCQN